MDMQISGVSGLAVEPETGRGLPALPTDRTAEPRSTRFFRFMTAMGDLRRSKEEFLAHLRRDEQAILGVSRGNEYTAIRFPHPTQIKKVSQTLYRQVGKQS